MFEKAIEADAERLCLHEFSYELSLGYESSCNPGSGAIEGALHLEQQAKALNDSLAPVCANWAVVYEVQGIMIARWPRPSALSPSTPTIFLAMTL